MKAAVEVWVIWAIRADNVLSFYGAVEGEEKAKAELAVLKDDLGLGQFHYSRVMLVGWAFNKETGQIYSNDDPSPQGSGSTQ